MSEYVQNSGEDFFKFLKDVDRHIVKNRITKPEILDIDEYVEESDQKIASLRGKLPEPEIDTKMHKWALKQDFGRPWGGNDYVDCPEMYCAAVKRRLEHEVGMFFENYPDGVPEKHWYTVFPPVDVLPLHDAIFVEGETTPLVDPRPEPKRKKNWWDADVLRDEAFEYGRSDDCARMRVDGYLRQSKDLAAQGLTTWKTTPKCGYKFGN